MAQNLEQHIQMARAFRYRGPQLPVSNYKGACELLAKNQQMKFSITDVSFLDVPGVERRWP
jgi:hypothetical protein